MTRLKATGGSVLLNIILSLNLNYAFICAHDAMQDYMNRGNCLSLIKYNLDLLCIDSGEVLLKHCYTKVWVLMVGTHQQFNKKVL